MENETKDTVQLENNAMPEPTVDTKVAIAQDFITIRAKKDDLILAGKDLFKEEIISLEEKEKALTAKIEAAAKETETEAEQMTTGIMAIEKTFWEKYGNEVLNGVEIVALAAIIYRLFF